MMILRAILISLEAICSLLLIGVILIQKAKGGGLGLAFGGGGTDSLFGSRAGNVLTKATVVIAIIFMANTVALAILYARSHDRTLMDSQMTPSQAQPVQPVGGQQGQGQMPQQQLPASPGQGFDAGSPTPTPDVSAPMEQTAPAMQETTPVEVELPEEPAAP